MLKPSEEASTAIPVASSNSLLIIL